MLNFKPTEEQNNIINANLQPISVVACPGSGKTSTAVRRLFEISKNLSSKCSQAALLSYSNIAVDTFCAEYKKLLSNDTIQSNRIKFSTVDSFITTYILRPHAYQSMKCNRTPFLVMGDEPFLTKYKIHRNPVYISISNIVPFLKNGEIEYFARLSNGGSVKIMAEHVPLVREKIIELGSVGAYTHSLGRLWAWATLVKNQALAKALARKFPYIIIDEAQDIGNLEGEIFDQLIKNGSQVSLIGDPHQSIYGFNFANGEYLNNFKHKENVLDLPLTQNRRSIPAIVDFANAISGTLTTPHRGQAKAFQGAYYLVRPANQRKFAPPLTFPGMQH